MDDIKILHKDLGKLQDDIKILHKDLGKLQDGSYWCVRCDTLIYFNDKCFHATADIKVTHDSYDAGITNINLPCEKCFNTLNANNMWPEWLEHDYDG